MPAQGSDGRLKTRECRLKCLLTERKGENSGEPRCEAILRAAFDSQKRPEEARADSVSDGQTASSDPINQ